MSCPHSTTSMEFRRNLLARIWLSASCSTTARLLSRGTALSAGRQQMTPAYGPNLPAVSARRRSLAGWMPSRDIHGASAGFNHLV
jgi:hypothetical protein